MRVHVAFTPGEAAAAPTGIVVDVLRATSTIAQALATGYERVLCVAELEEARALASGGVLALRVAETYPPERAGDAQQRMEAGGLRGRAVIVFTEGSG